MPNEVLAERTQRRGMRSGLALGADALWRNKPKFANQVAGRRSHHLPRPAIFAKFTKRICFFSTKSMGGRDQRPPEDLGGTNPTACRGRYARVRLLSLWQNGKTNYPSFRAPYQCLAEARRFGETNPMRSAVGGSDRKAKGGRDARGPGPPTFFRPPCRNPMDYLPEMGQACRKCFGSNAWIPGSRARARAPE